jgi:hypothetical protein
MKKNKNGSVTLGDALVYIERHKLGGDRVIHLDKLMEISLHYITKRFGKYSHYSAGMDNDRIYLMRDDNTLVGAVMIPQQIFLVKDDIFHGLERTLGLKNSFDTVKYFGLWLEINHSYKKFRIIPSPLRD